MHILPLLTLTSLAASAALPQTDGGAGYPPACANPRVRKSWHNLTNPERTEYLRAVKCLFALPAQGTAYFPAAKNRHDDFATLHINQTSAPDPTRNPANRGVVGPGIHFNGVFLPWHRYAVWNYETALINECGYTGAQPYWDWTMDTPEHGARFNESPVFDPVFGFGGNGNNPSVLPTVPPVNGSAPNASAPLVGGCVTDGPFADQTFSLGPGYQFGGQEGEHCLVRNIQSALAENTLQWGADVLPLVRLTEYWNVSLGMSVAPTGKVRGIHGGGHSGVNGEMQNVWSSINDPLFFMHHAMIDYVWWYWQHLAPQNLWAIGGPVWPNGTGLTTLDSPVYMTPFVAPDVPIRSVMDVLNEDGSGVLCYTYEDAGHPAP
ncbi:Di-copper centre-containing protein [Trichodelitschia bisporula]|uniref:Di-copper centre-containing protein n=1 Tax=Trichodelitschia bisporula TaxID=703511 RepID=A0A6G1HNC2_9PEZI|nr:Di-copper centre-containing protein [Trichodelitschia bisporula]